MIKKISKHMCLCILILISFKAVALTPQNQNWYDNFIFHDPSFTFEFIRTLGYAYHKGADLGEAVATAKKITDGDFDSWYKALLAAV